MIWNLYIGVLAAFGLLCMLWSLFGWLIPGSRGGVLLCLGVAGLTEDAFFHRICFLRDLGLLRLPLIIVDSQLEEPERKKLAHTYGEIELCSWEELPQLLELERREIDGAGNGNYPGCDQRRGVSEL